MKEVIGAKSVGIYNSPLEVGLRILILLVVTDGQSYDLQRLISYDYLLVYSGDVENGPPSVHPSTPYRAGELIVKRTVMKDALLLMCEKQLIDIKFEKTGILYKSSSIAELFLNYFDSSYYKRIFKIAQWVISTFTSFSDDELESYMAKNIGKWGREFTKESIFREVVQYE